MDREDFDVWITEIVDLTDEQFAELMEVIIHEEGARKDLSKH